MFFKKKTNKPFPKSIKQYSNVNFPKYPKTNCDGCQNQPFCKYGYVIYDDIENTKMTLVDKFTMLHAFDSFEPEGDWEDIANLTERHNGQMLMKMDMDKLHRTLDYLQKQKALYLAVGKCGRSYFNFMCINNEITLLKETIARKENK